MITEAVYRRALGLLMSGAQFGSSNQQTMPSQQSAAAAQIVLEYERQGRLIAQMDGRSYPS